MSLLRTYQFTIFYFKTPQTYLNIITSAIIVSLAFDKFHLQSPSDSKVFIILLIPATKNITRI